MSEINGCENFKFKQVPGSIKGLLEFLVEEEVVIVLESGEEEAVEVEAVIGNLLVATVDCDDFKFIDISCICAVIVRCEDVLENILRGKKGKKSKEKKHFKKHCKKECKEESDHIEECLD